MIARAAIPMLVALVVAHYCAPLVAQTGVISGKVSPANDAMAVAAVDRTSGKRFATRIDRDGPDDKWLKVQDVLFLTLYRERLQRAEFNKKKIVFSQALGGVALSAESPHLDLGVVHLPPVKEGVRFVDIDPHIEETQPNNLR